MTKLWRCSQKETFGALYLENANTVSSERKQLSTNSHSLIYCLSALVASIQVKNCGIYLVIDDVFSDSGILDRPRDYFYNMPGLVAGLALNKMGFSEHSGITVTFLGSAYGILQAVDQAIVDFSCGKVETIFVAYTETAKISSVEDEGGFYSFGFVTRSIEWLQKVQPHLLDEFSGRYQDLIEKFEFELITATNGPT